MIHSLKRWDFAWQWLFPLGSLIMGMLDILSASLWCWWKGTRLDCSTTAGFLLPHFDSALGHTLAGEVKLFTIAGAEEPCSYCNFIILSRNCLSQRDGLLRLFPEPPRPASFLYQTFQAQCLPHSMGVCAERNVGVSKLLLSHRWESYLPSRSSCTVHLCTFCCKGIEEQGEDIRVVWVWRKVPQLSFHTI